MNDNTVTSVSRSTVVSVEQARAPQQLSIYGREKLHKCRWSSRFGGQARAAAGDAGCTSAGREADGAGLP